MSVPDDMLYESSRLATFSRWPHGAEAACNPRKMAEAGFYANGARDEPDLAACFLCGKQMDGWHRDDDPWTEHRDHAPACLFVQLNAPEADMSLEQFFGVAMQFALNALKRERDDRLALFASETARLRHELAKNK